MTRLSASVDVLARWFVVLAVVVMTVAVAFDIVLRAFGYALYWADELSRYLFVWITFVGAGVALKKAELTNVTIVIDRLPSLLRRILSVVVRIAAMVFLVVIAIYGFKLGLAQKTQVSPNLQLPMIWPYLAVPVGSVVMIFHLIAAFFASDESAPKDVSEMKGESAL